MSDEKKNPPHWTELIELPIYSTVQQPFYCQSRKQWFVRVIQGYGTAIETHTFVNKKCAFIKFEELKKSYGKKI